MSVGEEQPDPPDGEGQAGEGERGREAAEGEGHTRPGQGHAGQGHRHTGERLLQAAAETAAHHGQVVEGL